LGDRAISRVGGIETRAIRLVKLLNDPDRLLPGRARFIPPSCFLTRARVRFPAFYDLTRVIAFPPRNLRLTEEPGGGGGSGRTGGRGKGLAKKLQFT